MRIVREWVGLLRDPQQFKRFERVPLEKVVSDYLKLLILCSLLGGMVALVFSLGRTVYYDLVFDVTVQYGRMFNYLVSRVFSIAFFYLFSGTFFLFILSAILMVFIRMKYAYLMKILLLSMTPLLLFSWIPFSPVALFIWSIFLFSVGIKTMHKKKIRKDSLQQRD